MLKDVILKSVATVQVCADVRELASKVTVSEEPGTDAPLAPPEVADQFTVVIPSHIPVPPTQNLAAILDSGHTSPFTCG